MNKTGKITIVDKKEYVAALSILREYFKNRPPFFEPHWREMTYLLQGVCKFEINVLGLMANWTPTEDVRQGGVS